MSKAPKKTSDNILTKKEIQNILDFSMEANELKLVERYSELKKHNKEFWGDYSAGHSWRLALLILLFTDDVKEDLDIKKMLELAVIHDIAETLTGDIDAWLVDEGIIKKVDKHRDEQKALKELLKNLPTKLQEKIKNIWNEYEEAKTKEARFVKVLDKVEAQTHMLSQDLDDKYDVPDFILRYADKPVSKCSRLKPVMDIVKSELLEDFKKRGIKYHKPKNL